jgi:hypothetical protein
MNKNVAPKEKETQNTNKWEFNDINSKGKVVPVLN